MPAGLGIMMRSVNPPPWVSIPGCCLALEADKGVSTGATFTWADQSIYSNNATQTSAPAQPTTGTSINGQATVNFNGTSQCLNLSTIGAISSSSQTWTVAQVFLLPATTTALQCAFSPLFAGSGINGQQFFGTAGGYQSHSFLANSNSSVASVGFNSTLNTSAHVLIWSYDGGAISATGSYAASLDGTAKTLVASGNLNYGSSTGQIAARASTFFTNIDFGLIMVFTPQLTGAYQHMVLNYTLAKYGVG